MHLLMSCHRHFHRRIFDDVLTFLWRFTFIHVVLAFLFSSEFSERWVSVFRTPAAHSLRRVRSAACTVEGTTRGFTQSIHEFIHFSFDLVSSNDSFLTRRRGPGAFCSSCDNLPTPIRHLR